MGGGTLGGRTSGGQTRARGPLGGPLGNYWGFGDPCGTLAGPSENLCGTLASGGPLGRPLWDPTLTLGGPLGNPWRTLGGPSEDPWGTLRGPCCRTAGAPPRTYIKAAKVWIHVPWPDDEVCVSVKTAKMCIHVPAPQSEVCLNVHIVKVCIHVAGPETEVCANVQKPPRCVCTRTWAAQPRYMYKCKIRHAAANTYQITI